MSSNTWTSAGERWTDESDWYPFNRDDPPLPNCENYGVFYTGEDFLLGRHRRDGSCRGGFIDPDVGLEGGVEAGFDAIQVTGGGPNEGLWYVLAAHYTMDNASSINPFLKPGYSPPDTLDPGKVKKSCRTKLGYGGSGPLTANFYDYNTKCEKLDPFVEGNIGDRILDHEGEGTNGPSSPEPNGHEARLRQAAELAENDPYKIVEKLVDTTEEILSDRVEEVITELDVTLSDAADPDHFCVRDNFGANGNCGKAHVFNPPLEAYQSVSVYQDSLRTICF